MPSKNNNLNLFLDKTQSSIENAYHLGDISAQLDFDWPQISDVLTQLQREIIELNDELQMKNKSSGRIFDEMGDVLFSVIQLARHLQINADSCLQHSNQKFLDRFKFMLSLCDSDQDRFKNLSPVKKEDLWKKAKQSLSQTAK